MSDAFWYFSAAAAVALAAWQLLKPRVSKHSILLALSVYGESTGLQMRARLGLGTWRGSSLYLVLAQLEEDGLIASREGPPVLERGGIPRRYYDLTDAGRAWLATPDPVSP